MPRTKYTVGFVFDEKKQYVALIRKNRPAWQANRLNGIGGHIEGDEPPLVCMEREFGEEAENCGRPVEWKEFALIDAKDYEVYCFCGIGDPTKLISKTDEKIEVHPVVEFNPTTVRMCIENIPWLLAMAIDHLEDGRPSYAHIKYA